MFMEIHILPVLVVALLSVAVGSIWYSPLLFGMVWVRSIGKTINEIAPTKRALTVVIIKALVVHSILFGVVSWSMATEIFSEAYVVATFLLVVVASYSMNIAVWEDRPYSYTLIHIGYAATVLFGGSYIIQYWPW